MKEELLTVPETAKILKLSQITIYKRCKDGSLPGVKIGASWRIKKTELFKLIGITEDE